MRFSSFLAESHGADCPSKKLWKGKKTESSLRAEWWNSENELMNNAEGAFDFPPWTHSRQRVRLISLPEHTAGGLRSEQVIKSNYETEAQREAGGVQTHWELFLF